MPIQCVEWSRTGFLEAKPGSLMLGVADSQRSGRASAVRRHLHFHLPLAGESSAIACCFLSSLPKETNSNER